MILSCQQKSPALSRGIHISSHCLRRCVYLNISSFKTTMSFSHGYKIISFFHDFELILSSSATHISIHGPWDEVKAPSSSCPLRCREAILIRVLELLSSFDTFPRQTPLLGLRHLLSHLAAYVLGGQGVLHGQRDAGGLAGEGLARDVVTFH